MTINKKWFTFTLIGLFLFYSLPHVEAENVQTAGDVFNNFSDTMIYVLPSVAFGMTLGAKDVKGRIQFAESVGTAMGITVALKYSIDAKRPNGDSQSFPSGHTAITVTSAEFMRRRYGWKYGLPAYIVAGYVGYDRIRTKEHYIRDVVAGAGISFVSTYVLTKPYKGWMLQPRADGEDYGVQFSRAF